MLPEPKAFVRLVMETIGVEGPTALARELGMGDYGAPRKIADWLEGNYAPNYEATMLMLQRAGFLNLEAGRPWRTAFGAPLMDRQWYLLDAADRGVPPEGLAFIFSASEEEVGLELRQAREELAEWEEASREGEELDRRLARDEEADARAGEATPESLAAQVRDLRGLFRASEVALETRVRKLEQRAQKAEREVRRLKAKAKAKGD